MDGINAQRLRQLGVAGSRERGRPPRVLVMAPTRELAKQVADEFSKTAFDIVTTTIYGGTSYGAQTSAFRRGVDVVVGTPGRIIDHLERGTLDLSKCTLCIMDEADRMLDMG